MIGLGTTILGLRVMLALITPIRLARPVGNNTGLVNKTNRYITGTLPHC